MAEDTATASSASHSLPISFVGVATLVLIALGIFVIASQSSGDPLKAGTQQTNTSVDVTNSQNQQLLTEIKDATNPSLTIAQKKDSLLAIQSFIATSIVTIQGNTSIDPDTKQKRLDLYNRIQTEIATLVAKADQATTANTSSSQNSSDMIALTAKFNQDLQSLQEALATGTSILNLQTVVAALIGKNNGGQKISGGKYAIPYLSGSINPNRGLDCSGFISFLMAQLGFISAGSHYLSGQFGDIRGFTTFNATQMSNFDSVYGNANIVAAAKSGALKPGDLILSGSQGNAATCHAGNGVDPECHIVLYLGGDPSNPQSVAESTTRVSKGVFYDGPQYTSLTQRAGAYQILAVFRPPYTS